MDIFHTPDLEEKKTLLNGVKEINKEARSIFILNSLLFGLLYIILVGIFVGIHHNNTAGEITKYSGSTPQFDKYEDYIMSNFFTSSYDRPSEPDTSVTLTGDFSSLSSVIPYMSIGKTYTQIMNPEDYDFSKLDLKYIDRQYERRLPMSFDLPKDTQEYKDAYLQAKELFDEEMAKRGEAAKKIGIKEVIVSALLLLLYVGVIFLFRKIMISNCNKRLTQISSGKCLVARAALIGRERISRYRRESAYYVEAETEDHDRVTLRVHNLHYDNFSSNTPCFLIKYHEASGTYDQYDIVWNGLSY